MPLPNLMGNLYGLDVGALKEVFGAGHLLTGSGFKRVDHGHALDHDGRIQFVLELPFIDASASILTDDDNFTLIQRVYDLLNMGLFFQFRHFDLVLSSQIFRARDWRKCQGSEIPTADGQTVET